MLGRVLYSLSSRSQIIDIDLVDLPRPTAIPPDDSALRARLEGMVVIVTGAAGPLGSEIWRQVARLQPLAIVGLDAAETPLLQIQQEMRAAHPNVLSYSEIGSVRNSARLTYLFDHYGPSVLYHAAADKRAPMVESNLFEAAAEYGLDDFVIISPEKAVRPTNIVGLTKRFAAFLVGARPSSLCSSSGSSAPEASASDVAQASTCRAETRLGASSAPPAPVRTRFVRIRFGNLVGPNGSHTTIPMAVQLALEASIHEVRRGVSIPASGLPVKIDGQDQASGIPPGPPPPVLRWP